MIGRAVRFSSAPLSTIMKEDFVQKGWRRSDNETHSGFLRIKQRSI
ncbi:hypothetical protein HMPREF9413_3658 [Paenibacillus sp. HGF7]|nr:hypothetical protein HMPREF9413_3658 [Paenibacillus sp. HGF7]